MTTDEQAAAPIIPAETIDELYDHAPCGYLTTTVEGVILRVNETLLEWLGKPRSDLVGHRLQTLLTPGGRIFYETHCGPTLRQGGALHQVALDFARADGNKAPTLMDWRPVADMQGVPSGHRVLVVDTAQRRLYEMELIAERERARNGRCAPGPE